MGKLLRIAVIGSIVGAIVYGWRKVTGGGNQDGEDGEPPANGAPPADGAPS